jgi:hypothetical protein
MARSCLFGPGDLRKELFVKIGTCKQFLGLGAQEVFENYYATVLLVGCPKDRRPERLAIGHIQLDHWKSLPREDVEIELA